LPSAKREKANQSGRQDSRHEAPDKRKTFVSGFGGAEAEVPFTGVVSAALTAARSPDKSVSTIARTNIMASAMTIAFLGLFITFLPAAFTSA